ncbi:MAG: hypothetical protein IH586_10880 [Anaerolineaceae bacterium]|nr:hypothetical protein [Anaerolineaceae bacterium]
MDQAVEQARLVQIDPPGIQEAWEMVSGQLQLEMKQSRFESWVQPLMPVSFKEGVFRLAAVNAYARDWVEGHLRSRITHLLEGVYNQPLTVTFSLVSAVAAAAAPSKSVTQETVAVKADVPSASGRKKGQPAEDAPAEGSPRKIQLQRAYGTERARVIQPERGMFQTMYFFNNWLPLLGHSAFTTVMAARSLCYWNPMTGELRNVVETDMSEIARRAAVSLRTVKDVLNNPLIKRYFLRYKVRRIMTQYGVRTAGIILQVRMDDPLTPEDQETHHLAEDERWYTADFEDESEE